VFDPMVGTGSTWSAALRARRRSIGIELNPKYAALANESVAVAVGRAGARFPATISPVFICRCAQAATLQIRQSITSLPRALLDMLRRRGSETPAKRKDGRFGTFLPRGPATWAP